MGRPSICSPELAEVICERLIEGESMRKICRDESMPNRATLLRWMEVDEGFAAKCARARIWQADLMDDLVLETADACTTETAHADKVKISAYQWRAAKLSPKKYGDKTFSEAEINLRAGSISDKPLTDEEFEATHCANDAPKPQSNGHANGHGSGNGKAS